MLEIDMLEEPEDEDDLIFKAQNVLVDDSNYGKVIAYGIPCINNGNHGYIIRYPGCIYFNNFYFKDYEKYVQNMY